MAVNDNKTRIQISIANELLEKINAYCVVAGISKSAYLSMLAARDLDDTERYLNEFKKELEGVVRKLNEAVPE